MKKIIIIPFLTILLFGCSNTPLYKSELYIPPAPTLTVVPTAILSDSEIKGRSYPIDYQQLKKNPEKYSGEWHYFKGKVLQIIESGSGGNAKTEIRLGVTNKGYGVYDDVVYSFYSGETSFVEGDMIHAWGITEGQYCYTSQAGWEICVPKLDAKLLGKI